LSAPKSILTKGEGTGENANNIFFPDAVIGADTLINSEKFKYSSYYSRLRENIVNIWTPLIKKESEKQKTKTGGLPMGLYLTRLNIIIDAKGNIEAIFVSQESLIKQFDLAAIKAFRALEPLEPPPKELLVKGAATIQWEFVLVVNSLNLLDVEVRHF
jgi:TonB family protein